MYNLELTEEEKETINDVINQEDQSENYRLLLIELWKDEELIRIMLRNFNVLACLKLFDSLDVGQMIQILTSAELDGRK